MWVVFTQYKSFNTEGEAVVICILCTELLVDPAKKGPNITSSIWHILSICLSTRYYEEHSEETLGYCSPKPNETFKVYVSMFL